MKIPVLAAALVAGSLASGLAEAGGRHHHHGPRLSLGFHFGVPWYPAYYYAPPPVYYYPAPVVVQQPPVYTERHDAPPAAHPEPQQQWWYYCEQTRGYYPYVKSCPGGWQKVPPAPPPAGG